MLSKQDKDSLHNLKYGRDYSDMMMERPSEPVAPDHYDKLLEKLQAKWKAEGMSEQEIETKSKTIWTETKGRKSKKEQEEAIRIGKERKEEKRIPAHRTYVDIQKAISNPDGVACK